MRRTHLPKIVCQFAGLMLLVAAVASPARSQSSVVIAGNLGEGGSFQSSTGTAWATGPGAPPCGGNPCDPANAVAFNTATAYTMTQFKVAINWSAGPNRVTVGLYVSPGSNSVAAINCATLLQSFTLSSPAATTVQPGQLVTQSLTTPVLLSPGNTYFLEMTNSNAGGDFGWQWNNIEQTGYYAAFLPSIGSVPSWFAETCDGTCPATPAFEVDGVFQGPFAYVTNQTDGTVSVIDTSSGNLVT